MGQKRSYAKLTGSDGQECVRDDVTGLIWEQKVNNASSMRHTAYTYSWYSTDAANNAGSSGTSNGGICLSAVSHCDTESYIATLNSKQYCGYSDWRMPTRYELNTILDVSRLPANAFDSSVFADTQSGFYWTGTPSSGNSAEAWYVSFFSAETNYTGLKVASGGLSASAYYVRAVRKLE